jgi:hypothetical protein
MHSNATYRGRANILKHPDRLNVRSGSVAGPPRSWPGPHLLPGPGHGGALSCGRRRADELVTKARASSHDSAIRPFSISAGSISLGGITTPGKGPVTGDHPESGLREQD